jgi:hypothetical protein
MRTKLFYAFILFLGGFSTLTYLLEYLERNEQDAYLGFLWILIMPGFFLYVILTGDIHGWQPGPIGQLGRVLVTGFGSAIFWSVVYYFIAKRRITE